MDVAEEVSEVNEHLVIEEQENDIIDLNHEMAITILNEDLKDANNKILSLETLINQMKTKLDNLEGKVNNVRVQNTPLVIESRNDDPENPQVGRIWLRG